MSLKAFHIVFITCSTLLAFGFSVWAFHGYRMSAAPSDLVWGILGALWGVALIAYGRYVFRKLKNISYL